MFEKYVISISKFKLEKRLCFAAKINIKHVHRLQDELKALVKYIEDNDLNQYMKKSEIVTIQFYINVCKIEKGFILVRYFSWLPQQ